MVDIPRVRPMDTALFYISDLVLDFRIGQVVLFLSRYIVQMLSRIAARSGIPSRTQLRDNSVLVMASKASLAVLLWMPLGRESLCGTVESVGGVGGLRRCHFAVPGRLCK